MTHRLALATLALALAGTPILAQTAADPGTVAPAPAQDRAPGTAAETAVSPGAVPPPAPVETPEDFVAAAISSNGFEIESSRLALERAGSAEVRAFAQRMIDDHTTAVRDLLASAEAEGMPTPPLRLNARHSAMLGQLGQAEGVAFDELYASLQAQAHQEAIALHQSFAEEGDAGAVAEFAAEKLPVLETHLTMAQSISTQ